MKVVIITTHLIKKHNNRHLQTDSSEISNHFLSHITETEPNNKSMNKTITHNNCSYSNKNNLIDSKQISSEFVFKPTNPLLQIKRHNEKIKQKTSLIKTTTANSLSPLSYLTTKKISEFKIKQLSDCINRNNNDSLLMQKCLTSSSIPVKNNMLPNENNTYTANICKDILDDRLHQLILDENAQLKKLNEKYKQMLDSVFYFINSLSFGQNIQQEYDVNYYTDHINELNNSLL